MDDSEKQTSDRRYWAMRSARNTPAQRGWLYSELQAGRFRQGWSYDERQNLRTMKSRWNGVSWSSVTPEDKTMLDTAWPNMPMLGADAPSGVTNRTKVGDIIVIPNMPADGLLTLCEVSGSFTLDAPCDEIAREHMICDFDFASVLPMKIICSGLSKDNEHITGRLRQSLRTPSRFWSLNPYRENLEQVLRWVAKHPDRIGEHERNQVARADSLIGELVSQIGPSANLKLLNAFAAASWEKVLLTALQELSSSPSFAHTGGVN